LFLTTNEWAFFDNACTAVCIQHYNIIVPRLFALVFLFFTAEFAFFSPLVAFVGSPFDTTGVAAVLQSAL